MLLLKKAHIKRHLSIAQVKQRVKTARNIEASRRWQIILLRLTQKDWSARQIADVVGLTSKTVNQFVYLYNTQGPEAYEPKPRGGRRTAFMTLQEEKQLLQSISDKARNGEFITASKIRIAVERFLKHPVSKDYPYDLMHRHQWRKIMPRPEHPRQDKGKQEAFKKTSQSYWVPPESQ